MNHYTNMIVSLLVLLLIFYNQIRIRQVRKDMKITLPIILMAVGLLNLKNYFSNHTLTSISLMSIIVSLSVLAVGMGAIRAYTVKLWADNNIVFRQGTWVTIILWIVSIGLHLIVDQFGHTGQSTLLIYYGLTLSVQRWVVQSRARHIFSSI